MTRTLHGDQLKSIAFSTLPQTQEFPAMQFYPKEWITGEATRAMGPNQRGGFIDLLAEAWDQKPPCSLPDDDGQLANYARVGEIRWPEIGALIRSQFVKCTDGRLRNPKQVSVWIGMIELRDRRRKYRGIDFRSKIRASVLARDNFTCVYCGATDPPLHVDHVIPRSRGGSDDEVNLATACAPCNLSKNNRTPAEWLQ